MLGEGRSVSFLIYSMFLIHFPIITLCNGIKRRSFVLFFFQLYTLFIHSTPEACLLLHKLLEKGSVKVVTNRIIDKPLLGLGFILSLIAKYNIIVPSSLDLKINLFRNQHGPLVSELTFALSSKPLVFINGLPRIALSRFNLSISSCSSWAFFA